MKIEDTHIYINTYIVGQLLNISFFMSFPSSHGVPEREKERESHLTHPPLRKRRKKVVKIESTGPV